MDEIRNELVKLLASDGISDVYFGVSTAISSDGNTAIVGVPGHNTRKGIACIFTRNDGTWIQQAKLLASDGAAYDYFGTSVAISGDGNSVIVGSNGDNNEKGTNAGSAYIFTRTDSGWVEEAKLLASDGYSGDWFGFSVSISSDANTAIVGANWHNDGKGAAYIFTRSDSGWAEEAKLAVSDGDWFGSSVSINSDGDIVIVGTHWRSDGKRTAYVFNRRKTINDIRWFQQFKLLASNGYFAIPTPINTDGNTTTVL